MKTIELSEEFLELINNGNFKTVRLYFLSKTKLKSKIFSTIVRNKILSSL